MHNESVCQSIMIFTFKKSLSIKFKTLVNPVPNVENNDENFDRIYFSRNSMKKSKILTVPQLFKKKVAVLTITLTEPRVAGIQPSRY